MIVFPPFVDSRTAARYPIIVPPVPIAPWTFPPNTEIVFDVSGACSIEAPR